MPSFNDLGTDELAIFAYFLLENTMPALVKKNKRCSKENYFVL
jgi:hypothetical protein